MASTLKGRAGTLNIEIEQGATFAPAPFTWKTGPDEDTLTPVDLTGCSAVLEIASAAGTILHTMSTTGGDIALGDEAGTITLSIDADVTADFDPADFNGAVYNLDITMASTAVVRLLRGAVILLTDETPPVVGP